MLHVLHFTPPRKLVLSLEDRGVLYCTSLAQMSSASCPFIEPKNNVEDCSPSNYQ